MTRLIRAVICLFRKDCRVFQGDEFTEWLDRQFSASQRATEDLQREWRTGNIIEDDIFGSPPESGRDRP